MKRREFIQGAAAGLAIGAGMPSLGKASERPNVLFLLVDQWRTSRWFPKDAPLPGFDKLCSEGLSFTNHFTCAVPCSPSRATIFTGTHIPQHGVQINIGLLGASQSLDPSIPTLGNRFQQAGFRTAYMGKWHLSSADDYRKYRLSPYGFEDCVGPDRDGYPYEGLIYDGHYTEQTVRWLKKNGNQGPWFLTCSLINPHDIMYYPRLDIPTALVPDVCDKLPDNFYDDLSGKPRAQKRYQESYGKVMGSRPGRPERMWRHYIDFYHYLTCKVDQRIEKVINTLDELGLSENTIVVFTSDHGEMCGSHHLQGKGPFVYQENNCVPMVIRWPGRIEAGAQSNALTQSVDIFPTLLDLAGVPAATDHLPGKSLSPLVAAPSAAGPNDHVLMAFGYSADSSLMSMISHLDSDTDGQKIPMQLRAIYDGRYKYARYFDEGVEEEYELYDLAEDPLELRNLAADPGYKAKKKEMADRLFEAEKAEMSPIAYK